MILLKAIENVKNALKTSPQPTPARIAAVDRNQHSLTSHA